MWGRQVIGMGEIRVDLLKADRRTEANAVYMAVNVLREVLHNSLN